MNKTSAEILVVAGERSGDVYGADLANALRIQEPRLALFGCGGEAMRSAGVDTVVDAHQVAMAGTVEVLSGLPRAYLAFRKLVAEVERRRPSLAVLIDFPDFNLRLAKRLRRLDIPVVYFVSPQIWAWRPGRIRQIKKSITKMLCIFDFEERIYREAGIPVEYVGHPLVDHVRPQMSRHEFLALIGLPADVTTVALLPGSRSKEVTYNLPAMLATASLLAESRPVQFVLPLAPTLSLDWLTSQFPETRQAGRALRVVTQPAYEALSHADAAIVACGTATIESALCECPMVVVYRVSPVSWWMSKCFVKVPFYSMVNLLAGKEVVPELVQSHFTPQRVAHQLEYLLDNGEARAKMIAGLHNVKARLGPPGAIQRASRAVMETLTPILPLIV